jgi:CDP-diglyceride synthetase
MVCPVCSAGIVLGLGLSRWLKVDDAISGLWIGALLLALSFWTVEFIFKKKENKPAIALPVVLLIYLLSTIIPLYQLNIINDYCLTLFGVNRLIFGLFTGIIATVIALFIDKMLRKDNNGKARFPYQKVIVPIGLLVVISFILNNMCK